MKFCRFLSCCAVVCALTAALAVPATAELGVGTRALGMGGAFTAIADDTSAPYWNPAGLAKVKRFQFQPPNIQVRIDANLDWKDVLDNPPTDDDERINLLRELGSGKAKVEVSANLCIVSPRFAVFVQPVGEAVLDASGVTFTGGYPTLGSQATIRGTGYLYAGFSTAKKLKDGAALGVTVKSVRIKNYVETIEYTDATGGSATISETEEDKNGLGVDVGYIRDVSPNTSVGAVVRNLIRPSLGSVAPERQVNLGIAYRLPRGNVLLAADVQDLFDSPNLNLGAEFRAGKFVNLWGGIYERKPTLGLGLSILGAKLQFAYSPDNTSIMSGSLYF